jgi:hypothetical protein
MFVVSTDKSAINLEDLVNEELQELKCNDDPWHCPSLQCRSRNEAQTMLSTSFGFSKFILVFIKRPFDQPRTNVRVPLQMSFSTYQNGEMSATMVEGYLCYVVLHSTKGGNVPDAGNPESVSNIRVGHYFGCEVKSPASFIVDCQAGIPNETCDFDDINKWVHERGQKVVAVIYTTEKPFGWRVVRSSAFLCGLYFLRSVLRYKLSS